MTQFIKPDSPYIKNKINTSPKKEKERLIFLMNTDVKIFKKINSVLKNIHYN